ncbi:ribbon-helix-helix protein, CopG family [Promineifilum sp.]|uniref:ribbon-helix-helix protein, CopG family n=1 Tax=Promineifilum sp. TaxID=2664178 RepID=UPI0035ADF838
MMGYLLRTQVLLEPEQHRTLHQLAEAEGRSVSDLVRAAVAKYLAERNSVAQRQRELEALERLTQLRERIAARYGVYQGDLVGEVREERDAELEQVLRGET